MSGFTLPVSLVVPGLTNCCIRQNWPLDEELRLKVVRKMFEFRFGESAPSRRSVDQLRGIEGARVRKNLSIDGKTVQG